MDIIAQLEQEEIARLGKTIPVFAPGDTVIVQVKVKEGTRERSGKSARIKEKQVARKPAAAPAAA